jgi:hypothetical protein
MARIVLSSYVIRYPVGGVLSSNLQLLTGFRRLGHDVVLVEKAGYEDSCFDPVRGITGEDCSYGIRTVARLLDRHGLAGRWCYVAADGTYHGLSRDEVERVCAGADLYIDRGAHHTWDDETSDVPVRVLLDPDPGHRQLTMERARQRGADEPPYDAYYTYGHNIGTPRSPAPTAGRAWRHVFHPVDTSLYRRQPLPDGGAFTTVMNWRSLPNAVFDGRTYGMKDVEFARFERLPTTIDVPLEVAVEGRHVPATRLLAQGWRVTSALEVTRSLESFRRYVTASLGEFSVVKEVYAGLNVGWFSDRSAAYLAHGRPVVVQANGIRDHLPVGEGLFEVADVAEAADAITRIARDPERHAAAARRLAEDHLDTSVVLGRFLSALGIPSAPPTASAGAQGGSP